MTRKQHARSTDSIIEAAMQGTQVPCGTAADALTPDVIKAARTDAGMTQVELAAALIYATPQELPRLKEFFNALMTVRTWESGKHPPDPRNTRALVRILNIPE